MNRLGLPALLNNLSQSFALLAITIAAGLATLRAGKLLSDGRWLVWTLGALCGFGLWQYTQFGQLHDSKHLHIHDFSHYYLGGKYFDELRYTRLYQAWALGLEEGTPVRIDRIRDLSSRDRYQTRSEFLALRDIVKSHFTPSRWAEFVSDVGSLYRISPNAKWDRMLLDAGFNPSPTWVLASRLCLWLPPTRWLTLTLIDVALLASCVVLLGSTFGWTNTLFGLCLFLYFPAGHYSSYRWTGGSLLRCLWLFWLTLGMVSFSRRQMRLAGLAFGLSALERLFPTGFAVAAMVASVLLARRDAKGVHLDSGWRSHWQLPIRLGSGGLASIIIGFLIPCLIWRSAWAQFAIAFAEHTKSLFTNHFGWWKVASYYPGVFLIHFSHAVPTVFADWSRYMHGRLHWSFFMAWAALVIMSLWLRVPRALSPLPAICILGLSFMFFVGLPAHYYLIVLLPLGTIMAAHRVPLFCASSFWLIWPLCTIFGSVPETAVWFLASLLIGAYLTAMACYFALPSQSSGRPAWALVLTSLLFGGREVVTAPAPGAAPPISCQGARPARYSVEGSIERIYPDYTSHIIDDKGYALAIGEEINLYRPRLGAQSQVTITIRTDRVFGGRLELWGDGSLIHSWVVEGRGYVFDYLTTKAPSLGQYSLRWCGPGADIGMFQAWIGR